MCAHCLRPCSAIVHQPAVCLMSFVAPHSHARAIPPQPSTHNTHHSSQFVHSLVLCSFTQEVICWSCSAALTCLAYTLTAPAAISIPYGTCMGLIFGLCLYILRGLLLEELFKVCLGGGWRQGGTAVGREGREGSKGEEE